MRKMLIIAAVVLIVIIAALISWIFSSSRKAAVPNTTSSNDIIKVPAEKTTAAAVPGPGTYYVASDGSDNNPGTPDKPWANINYAAGMLKAGDTLYIRGGTYKISKPVTPLNSGTETQPITYSGYQNEQVVIDAIDFTPSKSPGFFSIDVGAFQLENVSFIKVKNLKVMNSYAKGIFICNSSNIEIINCTTENTFACGIAMWDYIRSGKHCDGNKILGCTVIKANTWDMLPEGMVKEGEPPHEAISIAGGTNFEVAYNHVYNCDKEGIDVKEISSHGKVHHNYVHNVDRQGLYADSWFGKLEDIEFYDNVAIECRGAGMAISAEGDGSLLENVSIHNNLLYNNYGTGMFFSRWGNDLTRKDIKIYNNTIVHNGYGYPGMQDFFWITGGLYLYSTNLENVEIFNNIISDNKAFQIGYSDLYPAAGGNMDEVFKKKGLKISNNLLYDANNLKYPLHLGWEGNFANVYPYKGSDYVEGAPEFLDEAGGNFMLKDNSPAIDRGIQGSTYNDPDGSRSDIGAFYKSQKQDFWWTSNFPPIIE